MAPSDEVNTDELTGPGGTLGRAAGDLAKAAEAVIALGGPPDPLDRTAVLIAVARLRAELDWLSSLIEAGTRPAAAPAGAPVGYRIAGGPVDPVLAALLDAARRVRHAGRVLTAAATAGRRLDGPGEAALRGMTARLSTALEWVVYVAEHGGASDAALATLLDPQ